jgi:tetratricopeptide (TPR) repeat protein
MPRHQAAGRFRLSVNRSRIAGVSTRRLQAMRRTGLVALPILLAALVNTAAADDRDLCSDGTAGRESRLAACTSAIASRQWRGTDLARLHVSRAEQYTFSRLRTLDKALEDCNAAIAIDPMLATAYRCRGVVYYERKDYDLAIAEQDRALALNPRFAGAYYDRGRAFAGKHNQERARADYDEAIKINPKYAFPYNGRGLVHLQLGEIDAAIADFSEAIKLDPKYTAPLYNRSRAFARQQDLDRALADADASLRIDPQYLLGHIRRGYVLKDMRNFDGALAAFSRAAELDPKSPRPAVGRGEVLADRKDYRGAIAQFDSAIRLDPGDAYAYSQRGFAYYRTGDLELALKDVNEALKHDPRAAGAYNTRGLVQHAKHDYDEALADLTQAIRLDPSVSNLYSNRGRTYNARKEFDRAIQDVNESIRLHPANSRPYMERAISYENKRERDKALADWRTTLRLDPDNQSAAKAIRRLEQEKVVPKAAAKTRVALVIGNSEYKFGNRLPNPVNDAGDFANVLRKLGFEVIEGRNLDKRSMDQKIAEFARKLDKAGIGLFFYAGHGIQVDGDNWLIPIDARIEPGDVREGRSANVKTASVNIAQVLAKMEAEQRVNLVFLDACRDNPFGRGNGGLAQPKGLAPIQNAVGTLTAFATKPYHVALDGDGRNSPFTGALLKHLATPGLEIGTVMKRVRVDVIKSTGGEQVPFDESSLITDVVLAQ